MNGGRPKPGWNWALRFQRNHLGGDGFVLPPPVCAPYPSGMHRVWSWLWAAGLLGCLPSLTGCRLLAKSPAGPFYPIGIYAVASTNDFRTVRDAGFNVVAGRA